MLETARTCSSRSVLPRSSQQLLQLVGDVEVVLDGVLAAAGDDDDVGEAGRHRLLDHVLDDRLVDERQHLLRLRLGGGQEARAEAGGGEDGLADAAPWRDASTACYRGACYPRGSEARRARPEVGRREPRARAGAMLRRRGASRGEPARRRIPGRWTRSGAQRSSEVEQLRHRQRVVRRGDRPPRPGEGGRLRAEGRDEGRLRRDQGPGGRGSQEVEARPARRPAAGCPTCPTPACPSGRDASANVEVRRVGEPPRFDFTPKAALGAGAGARHPRLRARGQDLGRALRGVVGRGRAAGARAGPAHARPAHAGARLPRGDARPTWSPRRP